MSTDHRPYYRVELYPKNDRGIVKGQSAIFVDNLSNSFENWIKLVIEHKEYDNKMKKDIEYVNEKMDMNKKIFIVHGHDEAKKYEVARFIEKLKLKPIILHEQPDSNRHILKKLEEESKDISYVIVLLTKDDLIHKENEKPKYRARQNVIFEYGYFVAKLGQDNVLAIYDSDVETLSDISGILYKTFSQNWESELFKELKNANFNIDANDMI